MRAPLGQKAAPWATGPTALSFSDRFSYSLPLFVSKSFTELVRQMAEVEIRLFETGRIEPRYSHSRCSRSQRFSHRTGGNHLQRSGLAETVVVQVTRKHVADPGALQEIQIPGARGQGDVEVRVRLVRRMREEGDVLEDHDPSDPGIPGLGQFRFQPLPLALGLVGNAFRMLDEARVQNDPFDLSAPERVIVWTDVLAIGLQGRHRRAVSHVMIAGQGVERNGAVELARNALVLGQLAGSGGLVH